MPKEKVSEVAREFARILLEDADAGRDRSPQSQTEDYARRVIAQPNHDRDAFQHFVDPNASDDDIALASALTDLGSEMNPDAAFDGREEPIKNVFKPQDILDALVAKVMERRSGK